MGVDPLSLGLAGGSLVFKGLSSLFGNKSKKKQQADANRANTNALNIAQKQKEDERRARVQLGASLVGGVPATTAGGGVRTNAALDPELVKQLMLERKYDFGSAMPTPGVGAGSAFLSGLFGGAADFLPYVDSLRNQGDSSKFISTLPGAWGGSGIKPTTDIGDLLGLTKTKPPIGTALSSDYYDPYTEG